MISWAITLSTLNKFYKIVKKSIEGIFDFALQVTWNKILLPLNITLFITITV